MNRLFMSAGIAVFLTATFVIMYLPNLSSAYGCTNSSNTNHTSSSVNGTSGNLTKSALTSSSQISIVDVAAKLSFVCCPCGPPP